VLFIVLEKHFKILSRLADTSIRQKPQNTTMQIKAVFFDIGETLVSEDRLWGEWADVIKVTRLTFFAALGGVIERDEHHRKVFEQFGMTYAQALKVRAFKGVPAHEIGLEDFYADAVPCLERLREAGFLIGLSGNQPARIDEILRELKLPVDFIASSASWGVEKPDPKFFERIVDTAQLEPAQIAYIGDRLDNDVLPARAAGLFAVFLEHGPWGAVHARRSDATRARARIRSLEELVGVLE
jgi:HAD superfamily hydrolase (TIGR01549 family)